MDVQPDLPCVQRGPRQHEARYSRLPDPAQLGQRLRRLLRAVLLGRTATRSPRNRRTAARRARPAGLCRGLPGGISGTVRRPTVISTYDVYRRGRQWKTEVGVGSGGIDGPLGLGDGEGGADEG